MGRTLKMQRVVLQRGLPEWGGVLPFGRCLWDFGLLHRGADLHQRPLLRLSQHLQWLIRSIFVTAR